jgi:hypothetical protein
MHHLVLLPLCSPKLCDWQMWYCTKIQDRHERDGETFLNKLAPAYYLLPLFQETHPCSGIATTKEPSHLC